MSIDSCEIDFILYHDSWNGIIGLEDLYKFGKILKNNLRKILSYQNFYFMYKLNVVHKTRQIFK